MHVFNLTGFIALPQSEEVSFAEEGEEMAKSSNQRQPPTSISRRLDLVTLWVPVALGMLLSP